MFEKIIESPHGMGQLNAVFETKSANYTESTSESYSYNAMEAGSTSSSNSLNFEMYYWVSVESRTEFINDPTSNNFPLLWLDTLRNGSTSYFVNDLDDTYAGLSAELKAEKYTQEVILA